MMFDVLCFGVNFFVQNQRASRTLPNSQSNRSIWEKSEKLGQISHLFTKSDGKVKVSTKEGNYHIIHKLGQTLESDRF